MTPLFVAAEKGHAEIAALLVKEGGAAVDQVRAERVRWAQPADRVEREYLLLLLLVVVALMAVDYCYGYPCMLPVCFFCDYADSKIKLSVMFADILQPYC